MGTVISVKNVVKIYNKLNKKHRTVALDGISFDIEEGKVFGFLGPNGSGKTTIIKIILGIIPQTSGQVDVLGQSPMSRIAKKDIGYLPERPYYPDFTTSVSLLQFYGSLYDMKKVHINERIEYVLHLVGLGGRKKTKLKEYSKGMLQRFGLAQALLHSPKLYIFDEPASGLDPAGQRMVRDIMLKLRSEGNTVFFSSHQLSEAEMICDAVAIVDKGNLISCGSMEDLLSSGKELDLSQKYSVTCELPENLSLEGLKEKIKEKGFELKDEKPLKFLVSGKEHSNRLIRFLQDHNCIINSVILEKRTLEEVFLEKVGANRNAQ